MYGKGIGNIVQVFSKKSTKEWSMCNHMQVWHVRVKMSSIESTGWIVISSSRQTGEQGEQKFVNHCFPMEKQNLSQNNKDIQCKITSHINQLRVLHIVSEMLISHMWFILVVINPSRLILTMCFETVADKVDSRRAVVPTSPWTVMILAPTT